MGPGNGPSNTNDLRINGLDLLGRKRFQETRWAHLFCFLLTSFCEIGFVGKALKYAIKGFSHEIVTSLKYTISYHDRGSPVKTQLQYTPPFSLFNKTS
jgi:hypothetical protein